MKADEKKAVKQVLDRINGNSILKVNAPEFTLASLKWLIDAEIRLIPGQIEKLANTYFDMKAELERLAYLVKANAHSCEDDDEGLAELTEAADRVIARWFETGTTPILTEASEIEGGARDE